MKKNELLTNTCVISLVLGSNCNLNCTYCYQHHKYTNKSMKLEYADKLFEELYKNDVSPIAYDTKFHKLDLIGGEPLVYIDLIDKIVELWLQYFNESKFTGKPIIIFNTNGVLVDTPKVQKFFKKYGDFIHVEFSIDGCKEAHDENRVDLQGNGSFDRVWKNFMDLDSVRWKAFRWTIDPTSVKYFFETVKGWVLSDMPHHWEYQFNYQSTDWDTYGVKDLHEQYAKLYQWYCEQTFTFQVAHPILTTHWFLTSIAESLMKNAIICSQTRVCLDFDGIITKCNCVSKVTTSNFTDYGHIMDEDPEHRSNMWNSVFSYICGNDCEPQKYDSDCYHCPIGSKCGLCPLSNRSYSGDPYYWPKNGCNVLALSHIYHVLFRNQFLLACELTKCVVDQSKIHIESDQISTPMNLLVPKCWALELITEEEYQQVALLTEAVGGKVNPITTKYYTDADLEVFKREYEKVKDRTLSADLERLPDDILKQMKENERK